MNKKFLTVLSSNNIVIPTYILGYYKQLAVSVEETLFIYYLASKGKKVTFDIKNFTEELSLDQADIMVMISTLTDKKLLAMVVEKNSKGVMEEYIDISSYYDKLEALMVANAKDDEKEKSDIFVMIEREFGRCLSPIEYETIKKWLDSNISEELIYEALKEAILNGVSNLKYIDKILYEWTKKGYKKATDIVKKKAKNDEQVEVFDYDWLDDHEG